MSVKDATLGMYFESTVGAPGDAIDVSQLDLDGATLIQTRASGTGSGVIETRVNTPEGSSGWEPAWERGTAGAVAAMTAISTNITTSHVLAGQVNEIRVNSTSLSAGTIKCYLKARQR